jgi:cytoskeletal protein RodZ
LSGDDRAARLAAFGRWLSQQRELRGLSRAALLEQTRISPAAAEALETGDEARLPPRAYLYGALRLYAGAAGIDADEAVLRFEEAAGSEEEGARARRPRAATRALALAAAAAALALGAAWLLGRR